jgi:hypothetical protein
LFPCAYLDFYTFFFSLLSRCIGKVSEKEGVRKMSLKDAVDHVDNGSAEKGIMQDESSGEELVTVEKGYENVIAELPHAEGQRALKKVDYRLVPLLSLLYLVAFIDRSNIGNAKIAGLEDDLNLEGLRYNTVVTAFFVSYGLFEVPSNIVLKLWRPSSTFLLTQNCVLC